MKAARVVSVLVALCATVAFAGEEMHGKKHVDLALVLAIDESASIDEHRWHQQMGGYAKAFRHRDVQRAIASGSSGCIAVTVLAWSHVLQQQQTVPWTIICGQRDAENFAKAIDAVPRTFQSDTAIAAALDYATQLFRTLPVEASNKAIDISGDGSDNTGGFFRLESIRIHAVKSGIVINGLPIVTSKYPGVVDYYEKFVIGGRNAFLVVANSYDEFAEAIRRKLILEIAWQHKVELATLQ